MAALSPQPENAPESRPEPVAASDPAPDSGLRPCRTHPKEMTRLTCTHCESPICPKCMIACEVGFKCRQCTTKTHSHLVKAEPRDYLLGGGLALALGLAFGYLAPLTLSLGYGYFMVIACFFVGRWAGDLIHRVARYKFAPWLVATINAMLVLGLLVSPMRNTLFWLLMELRNQGAFTGYWHAMPLMAAVVFIVGVQFAFQHFRRR